MLSQTRYLHTWYVLRRGCRNAVRSSSIINALVDLLRGRYHCLASIHLLVLWKRTPDDDFTGSPPPWYFR